MFQKLKVAEDCLRCSYGAHEVIPTGEVARPAVVRQRDEDDIVLLLVPNHHRVLIFGYQRQQSEK